MSIAGLIMQQLSRNKFVSPTTAGTLDATRLGILVSMLLFANASMLEKMAVAFIFALGRNIFVHENSRTGSNSKMRYSFRLLALCLVIFYHQSQRFLLIVPM